MARFLSTVAGLSLASVALSTPLQSHQQQQLYSRQNASSPCAQVSASVATQSAVATPTVAAQLAYDCITSVPFNKTAAKDLVDGVVPYFKWQSNTAFLKDPPQEYAEKVQPAVDIWGELEKIRTKVASGTYANEFEVRSRWFSTVQARLTTFSLALNSTCFSRAPTTDILSTCRMSLALFSTLLGLCLWFRSPQTAKSCPRHMFTPMFLPSPLEMPRSLLPQSARLTARTLKISWRSGPNTALCRTAMRCTTTSSTSLLRFRLALQDLESVPLLAAEGDDG
jgi:hypothetical protein